MTNHTVTIEYLEIRFDAERQRDEAVFAELFARHIAAHDDERERAKADAEQARAERSLTARSAW
jgi:hypothetical protein